ncbi:MAG: 3-dehydroquinate synthase [Armatimonadetes bacterium]|nr:3-dehydroquinate synthase [Armatimonadota bacterium]NOG94093.1 3-dehydroquinate synthase [Armatimonadota bacterium]
MSEFAFPGISGTYPVWVRNNTVAEVVNGLLEHGYEGAFVVTDSNVQSSVLDDGVTCPVFVCEPGESSKSHERLFELERWLAQQRANRQSVVVAVGGGVVGDLAGFAAAVYMRGVAWVNCATSLIAMVDSSLGGKTGIDLPEGKNLVGSFHDPASVVINPRWLSTLSDRDLKSGLAEVIKYTVLLDAKRFEGLESWISGAMSRDEDTLEEIIAFSIKSKASIVGGDPLDRKGQRAMLNLGHTVGHAIEAALGYQGMLHGEAVAVGMVLEAQIGEAIGFTQPGTSDRIREAVRAAGLPAELPREIQIADLERAMEADKKNVVGGVSLALVPSIGEFGVVQNVPADILHKVVTEQ